MIVTAIATKFFFSSIFVLFCTILLCKAIGTTLREFPKAMFFTGWLIAVSAVTSFVSFVVAVIAAIWGL